MFVFLKSPIVKFGWDVPTSIWGPIFDIKYKYQLSVCQLNKDSWSDVRCVCVCVGRIWSVTLSNPEPPTHPQPNVTWRIEASSVQPVPNKQNIVCSVSCIVVWKDRKCQVDGEGSCSGLSAIGCWEKKLGCGAKNFCGQDWRHRLNAHLEMQMQMDSCLASRSKKVAIW